MIAEIVERLTPFLHIDPVDKLPPEITSHIFLYLSPADLLRCSMTSKRWRERTMDRNLWRLMFSREGWVAKSAEIRSLEEAEVERRSEIARIRRQRTHRRKPDGELERSGSRKRMRNTGENARRLSSASLDQAEQWSEQHGLVEADDDQIMQEAGVPSLYHAQSMTAEPGDVQAASSLPSDTTTFLDEPMPLCPPIVSGLFDPWAQTPRVSWQYLYKQRRLLEQNWAKGRYTTFQLPHRDHPEQAHDECVYTIQYSGKWLVSGSRDKTIRIWDLDTRLLHGEPLSGPHTASVLCLQFDEKENIIVSGGSDSYVVIWSFNFETKESKVVRKLDQAHDESVLNLRFDHRYLITCSKDKTIKIWNRHQVFINDPLVPVAALHRLEQAGMNPLGEYTLLQSLEGHGAAVNAIQVYDNKIVSASGDRTIKLWDIQSGQCLRTFPGHTKGIACVQYDGRRIVSGSSDNTVRIFDAATSAEVACLNGHGNLVRTVQARFGDMQEADEDLESAARAIDKQYFEARQNGLHDNARARGPRNAGSSDPSQICATGAKIPPGGGGNRWSRIVSGSYDETVIIWKKDYDGKWIQSRRLHQDEILYSRRRRAPVPAPHVHAHAHAPNPNQQQQQQQTGQAAIVINGVPASHMNLVQAQAVFAQNGFPVPNVTGGVVLGTAPTVNNVGANPNVHIPAPVPAANVNQQQQPGHPAFPHPNAVLNSATAAALNAANQRTREDSNRVFKLQFDSRRVVCCSQNKIIVGWDFANGDRALEEASRFFGETD